MLAKMAFDRLEKSIEEYLDSQGYELVDLRVVGTVSNPIIEVYCDIETGITAEDCGNIAKSLRYRLEVEGFFEANTTLIVSSPGLDRVIKRPKDFERFHGREVKVWLEEPIEGRGKLTGVLEGFDDGSVHLKDTEVGDVVLSRGRWKEIRLVPKYPKGFK